MVVPTAKARSTSGEGPTSLRANTSANISDVVSRADFNALQDAWQQLRSLHIQQDQVIKALQDRLAASEQGLEVFGRVLRQVWPPVGGAAGSISSLEFPFSAGGSMRPPHTPPRSGSPAVDPSSPTPRAIGSSQSRQGSMVPGPPESPLRMPGSSTPALHPSSVISPAPQDSGAVPFLPDCRPSPFLSPHTQLPSPFLPDHRPSPFLSAGARVLSTTPITITASLPDLSPLDVSQSGRSGPTSGSLLLSASTDSLFTGSMEIEEPPVDEAQKEPGEDSVGEVEAGAPMEL